MAIDTKVTFVDKLKRNVLFKLYKFYIIDSILIVKNEGIKALLVQRGKKFVIGIFVYYLIRDSIIYIVIPLLIAKGLLQG